MTLEEIEAKIAAFAAMRAKLGSPAVTYEEAWVGETHLGEQKLQPVEQVILTGEQIEAAAAIEAEVQAAAELEPVDLITHPGKQKPHGE